MNKVRMFGPLGSYSGYGNAVKNFAESFSKSNIPTKYHFGKKAEDDNLEFFNSLKKYYGETNIDFYLHGPPWSKHQSRAYKIGYFYWEADRLPLSWERMINQVNEIWAPCDLVLQGCLKAGFKGDIKIVPTPRDFWNHNNKIEIPSIYSDKFKLSSSIFKFYSIFQWHERKGFRELLISYLREFENDDDVILILKVNPLNVNNYTEENIKKDILEIKRKLNQKKYPKLFLSSKLIDNSKIEALHNSCDCYISPHHGEGWGVPIQDAMLAKKHLIVTKFGGITEWLDEDSANLLSYKLGSVTNMEWSSLYGNYQKWAYPSIRSISEQMRYVYENHKSLEYKKEKAFEIANNMTIEKISKVINRNIGII